VINFYNLKIGDQAPTTGRIIESIIIQTSDYIICLDDTGMIDWATNEDYGEWPKNSGKILNKVSLLEHKTGNLFKGEE
jgi:hypothetical protein